MYIQCAGGGGVVYIYMSYHKKPTKLYSTSGKQLTSVNSELLI